MLYTIEVYETRTYRVQYTVEADSEQDALEAAEAGDTELDGEVELQLIGVASREPITGTLQALEER